MDKQDNGTIKMTETKNGAPGDPEINHETQDKMTLMEKLKSFVKFITVEPLLAFYIMPSVLASLAIQNLNLEKACRVNKNYTTELCDGLIHQTLNNTSEELEVQTLVAYMGAWRLPLSTAIPAITILFVGAWSDRTGKRKPCLLFPILGELITAVGLILCTYYFLEWPLEVAGVIEGLPPALTGGYATMFLGVFTYLADNTKTEDRTFRIGIVNTFISLALPVGLALSGTLLNTLGFYGVFTISICFYIAAFLYGFIRIKDKKRPVSPEAAAMSRGNACLQFFNWRHVIDTFYIIIKKRKSNRRMQTIMLVLCYIVVSGPVHGSGVISYLYARRNFQFTEVDFSIFSAYSIIVNFFGVMFALSVLSKYMKVNDCLLGAIACVSKVLASFVYAFAPSKEWFYLAPLVELVGGTAVIAMRSMATKVVDENEIGKINSVFGVSEAVVNAVYGPIFATFYVQTVATFPGAYCLLSALLVFPSVLIFLYMYKLQKIEEVEDRNLETTAESNDNLGYEAEVSHF